MAQNQWLFDNGWQFSRDGKTVTVDLPHDWDIYVAPDPTSGATGTGGGWYPGGQGEYRKRFKTPDAEIVRLHFEGVYQQAEVFVNGQKTGQHAYGYTPFTIDVTPYLYQDKRDNEVVVKVDNSQQPNCRWYSGSGIYRHVWLQTKRKQYIDEQSVYVTTPDIHTVHIQAEVVMTDGSRKPIERTIHVEQPHLWTPDDPYLYHTTVEAEGDVVPVTYGIRTISFDAEKGFLLNGKPLLINGACVHHDDGVLGAMAFDAAEIRKVRQMKDAGFNLVRTSHNPTTRAFLDACDSIGMLVIGEAFDGWRTAKTPHDYSTLIDSCLDYLGESGIGRTYYEGERPGEHYVRGGQPDWHGAYCGDVDITGWRKPISHYRELLWKDSPDLYMAVREPDGYRGKIHLTAWSVWPTWESWNWQGCEGKAIDVEVYTKAPEVRLYLNDRLIGTKTVSRATAYKAVFPVPYEAGTLRAEVSGKSVTLQTAGEPARLRLAADRSVITGDGQDLAYITVEVVDSEGRVCPEAAIPCEAIVKGQGQLLAFASADLTDREAATSASVKTWKGRALLVVRSSGKRGRVQVTVKSNLPSASLSLQTFKPTK